MSVEECIFAAHALRIAAARSCRPAHGQGQDTSRQWLCEVVPCAKRAYDSQVGRTASRTQHCDCSRLSNVWVADADDLRASLASRTFSGRRLCMSAPAAASISTIANPANDCPATCGCSASTSISRAATASSSPRQASIRPARYVLTAHPTGPVLPICRPRILVPCGASSTARIVTKTSRRDEMRDGSRKQWLNDLLCRHACSCDSFTALLMWREPRTRVWPRKGSSSRRRSCH